MENINDGVFPVGFFAEAFDRDSAFEKYILPSKRWAIKKDEEDEKQS